MALTINLTSPTNGATDVNYPWILFFTCSGDEPSQDAELYINGDFNRTKFGFLEGLQATGAVGSLEDNTTYTWQIRGFKENPSPPPATLEVWSDGPWSFTTGGAPVKATNPTPAAATADVTLDQATITWVDGGGADTFDVYYGTQSGNLTKVSNTQAGVSFTVAGITDGSPYSYLTTRYWRIDSTNEAGTTTGDEWAFTTIRLKPPGPTYQYGGFYFQLLVNEDGDWGVPPPVGVEDTDYVVVTYLPNFISTTRRLVGVANSKVWYEAI